ncbi:unnamed protein product [Cyclocybe aegerita]|uniref:Uncharacterized protein n=1 Tax=Cyclocybe aegerita TaxID=1973307 RepID=A0A8S0WGC4_CYCAE|nr:unnamed protein product [Cyclocybe aegerita]
MMDELLTPSPAKKRKSITSAGATPAKQVKSKKLQGSDVGNQGTQSKKSSATRDSSTSVAISAKPKPTQFKARPTQENAVAGPSTPRKPTAASQAPTRLSARVSRPTFKKAAVQRRRYTDSESDSDSDKTPPPSILPRYYAAKKRKLADAKGPTHKGKGTSTKHSVYLGAIELSSGSEGDTRPQPPRKRAKSRHDFSKATGVIDLCSDEEPTSSPTKTKVVIESDVIVILSSSDEAEPVKSTTQPRFSPVLPATDQFPPPISTTQQTTVRATTPPVSPPTASPEVSPEPNRTVDTQELDPAMDEIESLPRQPESAIPFVSPFTSATVERSPRQIKYADHLPTPALHTSIFFSKAAKSLELFARRKSSKKVVISQPTSSTPLPSRSPEEAHRVSSSTLSDNDRDQDSGEDSREETGMTISDSMDTDEVSISSGPATVPDELSEVQVQSQPERHDTMQIEVTHSLELEQSDVSQAEETKMPQLQNPVPISSGPVQSESPAKVSSDARQQNKEAPHGQTIEPDGLVQKAVLSSRKLVELLLSERASKAFASPVSPNLPVAQLVAPVVTVHPSNPVASSSVVSETEVVDAAQAPDVQVNKSDAPDALEPNAISLGVNPAKSDDSLAVGPGSNAEELNLNVEPTAFEPSSAAATTGVGATFELGMPTASGEPLISSSLFLPMQELPQVAGDHMSVDVAAPPLDNSTAELIDGPLQGGTPQQLFSGTHLDTLEPRTTPPIPRGSTVSSTTTEESPAPDTPPQKTIGPNHIRAFDITMLDLSEMSLPLLLESSKDVDDDAISVSGLELSYPEEVF